MHPLEDFDWPTFRNHHPELNGFTRQGAPEAVAAATLRAEAATPATGCEVTNEAQEPSTATPASDKPTYRESATPRFHMVTMFHVDGCPSYPGVNHAGLACAGCQLAWASWNVGATP